MTTHDSPLAGLFADDDELLAIPIVGDAWEAAEREVSGQLAQACGVRLSDLLALDRIQRAGRAGIRTNALARALRIPSNRLTYQLAGLEKRKFISRAPHPDDGRGIVLTLTQAGREMHRKALATYRRITRGGLGGVGDGADGARLMAAAAILAGRVPDADVARIAAPNGRAR